MPTGTTVSGTIHTYTTSAQALEQLQSASTLQAPEGVAYLTPDAMITYCQINLKSIDDQVDKFMKHQKSSLAERKAFQDVTQFMATHFDAKGPQTKEQWLECRAQVLALANSLPSLDPRRAKLEELGELLGKGENHADDWNIQHWKDLQSPLTTMTDDIKSGSELEMIELQSLISQRQTAVQLTTGILAKLNETLQSIAQKI